MRTNRHPRDLLAAYVNETTLSAVERRAVDEHLNVCAACRGDLDGWRALSSAVRLAARVEAAPGREVFVRIQADLASAAAPRRSPLIHGAAILRGQTPIVRSRIWPASALVMLLGFAVCLLQQGAFVGLVFTLLVPMVAAAGIAFIYGPEADPSLELALATPTSSRTILLARLTLVFGFDLLLAGLASAAIAALGLTAAGLLPLVSVWLGPMLLLSAGSLVLSLYFGGTAALAAASLAWMIRISADLGGPIGSLTGPAATQLWSTGPLALGLAAGLFALAIVSGTGRERLA